MWAMTGILVIFNITLLYLFFNQPVVLDSSSDQWDFRHADLRKIEEEQLKQLTIPDTSPESTPSADLRPQTEADQKGQVL